MHTHKFFISLSSYFSTYNEENIRSKRRGGLGGNFPVAEAFTFIVFGNCYKLNHVSPLS